MERELRNTGLCLIAPYIPAHFEKLGLTQNKKFQNNDDRIRASFLLDYLAGEQPIGNKAIDSLSDILCGNNTAPNTGKVFELTSEEITTSEQLLKAIIETSSALKNIGVNGFRAYFLKRSGILKTEDNKLTLIVEPEAADVLLEQLPWTYKTIKFPWMTHSLYVQW